MFRIRGEDKYVVVISDLSLFFFKYAAAHARIPHRTPKSRRRNEFEV